MKARKKMTFLKRLGKMTREALEAFAESATGSDKQIAKDALKKWSRNADDPKAKKRR